ncbi:unnamed protein product [Diatraea saccharalis]|uniref:Serpin domain-containing protein n=1 Tax=Diatraea saccharalis TaxID=40085 RepID=A0A9N9R9Y3_9NEOP|nr:unnamed protein product [Diatraea saccharalis]
MYKVIALVILCASTFAAKHQCNHRSALIILKRPTYDFSVKLLDRVTQANDGHFVYSPISTWLQLLTLAEGAHGQTLKEIWNVTKHHRLKCFRRKWRAILNRVDKDLKSVSKRRGFMIIDKLMNVKKTYVAEVERLRSLQVLLLDFNYPVTAADIANKQVESATNGVIADAFTPYDFNSTVLLMADTSYYKSSWKIPFNTAYTRSEPFYSEFGTNVGEVYMMNRLDYFNYTEIPLIGAKVLEMACGSDGKVSMLFFLPTSGSIRDLFYSLQRVRLMSIFNKFKSSNITLISVKIPRFKITTDIDSIPELLYDMGVKRVFHPDLANLRGISDYKVYASLMAQVSDIEVNEEGVEATTIADFLISNEVTKEFTANRPFAFLLVDKKTEVILFSGMYSVPSKY